MDGAEKEKATTYNQKRERISFHNNNFVLDILILFCSCILRFAIFGYNYFSLIKEVVYKSKITRVGQMKGKLVILSNELPFYQKSVIEMELQDDILFHYNKIESLIWEFGNIDQRWE